MDIPITEIGVGGLFSLFVLKEVFTFIKTFILDI